MLHDLIVNLAIIISFLFISGQFFKQIPMHKSIKLKVLGGFVFGFMGIVLMFFSIHITDTTIMDLRNFAIITVFLSGGLLSGIITAFILSLGRIWIFGVSLSSIIGVGTFIILVLVCWYISKRKWNPSHKFLLMNFANIFIVFCAYIILITDRDVLYTAILHYGIINFIAGYAIFSLCDFISRSNEQYRKLMESARTDFLTGLHNVRQFDKLWNEHIQNAKQKKETLSLVVIDIDYFKRINDTYGHLVGDMILKEFAQVLKETTRSIDTVSRNGGEEFSVILPECSYEKAQEIAERIRKSVERRTFSISNAESIHVTVSLGVVSYPVPNENPETMISTADDCLYQAKRSGRNRVVAYSY
ncbi:GGDEF domain-containing protein [Radiobacillus deserti]|uniref:GGDEF domain-containing protein n=1 Tax=Radiobacillus deserti TaxID=2594883 RepID=UPI0013158FD5|nr:diguanylate cyclase [Radiobacillus deserti]